MKFLVVYITHENIYASLIMVVRRYVHSRLGVLEIAIHGTTVKMDAAAISAVKKLMGWKEKEDAND